jgi:hypothetical protein
MARTPWAWQAWTISRLSAATTTCEAWDSAALWATRTTMGKPWMSAKGFWGSRVDAKRAGTMTVKACDMGHFKKD